MLWVKILFVFGFFLGIYGLVDMYMCGELEFVFRYLEKFINRYYILKVIKIFKYWIYIYVNMLIMMSICRFIEN